MTLDKETRDLKAALELQLPYSLPMEYMGVTVYPVTMKNYYSLQAFSEGITFRKESRLPDINMIKMTYLEFLLCTANNTELAEKYEIPHLPMFWTYALSLLCIACKIEPKQIGVEIDKGDNKIYLILNGIKFNSKQFDNLRRIIIAQNGIDYDIDTFINYDTEKALNAPDPSAKNDSSTLEDYIDSLCVAINCSAKEVADMPVRKFWRYIQRINQRDTYIICKTGEAGGMVTYKEPIRHWMSNINNIDKYKDKIIDEQTLKNKIG